MDLNLENIDIIICPYDTKRYLLKKISDEHILYNITFYTKEEFISKYYFSYDLKTINYLMNKYKYNIDVCISYLENMYYIEDKDYKNNKLKLLSKLKKELLDNNLLYINNLFKKSLKDKNIKVLNYYNLDKYLEDDLNYHYNYNGTLSNKIHKYNKIEDEISSTCIKILKLINKGIDINNIYLSCDDNYLYLVKKIFNYFNIPINLNDKESIYSLKEVSNYLIDKDINKLSPSTKKKILRIETDLAFIKDEDTYNKLLIHNLKNTYIDNIKYKDGVNKINIYNKYFTKDDYLFLLGFNSNIIRLEKDDNLIKDKYKNEVNLYNTTYKNKRNKSSLINIINNIKNITISYSNESSFEEFLECPLIKEYDLDVIEEETSFNNYSDIYNKLLLTKGLDNYYKYNEKKDYLDDLYSHYKIPYKKYSNKFDSINYKSNNIKLSYTSLNSYNECPFKYYLNYILKVDDYSSNFNTLIGSLYHEVLSHVYDKDFDLDKYYNDYLKSVEVSNIEKILLKRIKKELINFIKVINKQKEYTEYHNYLLENKFETIIKDKIEIIFHGFIDKVSYLDNKFSIVDYKSGNIDTDILLMKYGLHMQLPSYLYLINKNSNINLFGGIYYQKILFNYPKWSSDENKLKKSYIDNTKLIGYSTNNLERLEELDNTYTNSKLIKSMSYSDKFSSYTKLLSDEDVEDLIKYTEKIIKNTANNICNGNFNIEPKQYKNKNITCEYCPYKDICFYKEEDIKELDLVEDLSFLKEGVKNEMDA